MRENSDLIWLALRLRCRDERNWILSWPRRWWYAFKAIVCIVRGRQGAPQRRDWWNTEKVEVALFNVQTYDHYEFGAAGEFDHLDVGYGILRGWWYDVGSDGWP